MEEKVVLRFRDGRTERATLDPIDPTREVVTAHQDDGEKHEVPFSALKAVFYPRTVVEDAELEPASGMQIAIEFNDGEVIRGIAHYNPERNGFFLFPVDRSKNDRIFVVNSAIVSIEVEKM
jgi:hypothetical protein